MRNSNERTVAKVAGTGRDEDGWYFEREYILRRYDRILYTVCIIFSCVSVLQRLIQKRSSLTHKIHELHELETFYSTMVSRLQKYFTNHVVTDQGDLEKINDRNHLEILV